MKFITKHDIFGITILIKELYFKIKYKDEGRGYKRFQLYEFDFSEVLEFWIFFNQKLPLPWKASTDAVKRHVAEIREVIKEHKQKEVWVRRAGRVSCDILTKNFLERIESKQVELITYEEIENEKTAWQKHPTYKPENGYSEPPIKEEYIQLKLRTKGGEKK